ncbi:MAG: DUF4367 domain-containing protein [Eubacteriales bacterium]|nr:DUF4367 domain-containing protein [Eubacteriales bacterium]
MKRIKKHSVAMPRSQEAYQEELMALKIKMALEKEQQDEIARMQAACEKDFELQQFFLKTQPQSLRKIQRSADRARYKRFFTTPLPRAAGIAVCLMLTLFLALGVAVASSKTVRVSLTKYVMNVGRDFASFRFEETGKYVDVPVEWEGQYYPSYLPEGSELQSVDWCSVTYTYPDGNTLEFSEMDNHTTANYNTENTTVETINIHGQEGLLMKDSSRITVIWSEGSHMFSVDYTGGITETLKIAESVILISN